MANLIVYGLGGYCAECNDSHDHPLNNIVAVVELPDEPSESV